MISVKIQNLGLIRNKKWLFRNLDLSIPSGSLVAIVGPSGVGKSSFLSCLSGLEESTEGKIEYKIDSNSVHTPETIRPNLGIIFQSLRLTEHVTVLENVIYGKIANYGIKEAIFGFPKKDEEAAFRILKELGIEKLAHKWTSQTSGGEKQRTAIARTLNQNPKLILVDEPVSNLDTYYTGRVMGLFRGLVEKKKKIIFCALHDPQLISKFADYALSLNPENPEKWNLREINQNR